MISTENSQDQSIPRKASRPRSTNAKNVHHQQNVANVEINVYYVFRRRTHISPYHQSQAYLPHRGHPEPNPSPHTSRENDYPTPHLTPPLHIPMRTPSKFCYNSLVSKEDRQYHDIRNNADGQRILLPPLQVRVLISWKYHSCSYCLSSIC